MGGSRVWLQGVELDLLFLLSAAVKAAAAVNLCIQIPPSAADSPTAPHTANHKVEDGTMVTTLS